MNEITIMNVNDLPMIKDKKVDENSIFNMLQESEPLNNLVDKEFTITAIIPQMVQFEEDANFDEDGKEIDKSNDWQTNDVKDNEKKGVKYVDRLKVNIATDVGVFRSFSSTFNNSLLSALNIFGQEGVLKKRFTLKMKLNKDKMIYVLSAIK